MDIRKQIENILLEYESDAKQGYWHEPRTLNKLVKLFNEKIQETQEISIKAFEKTFDYLYKKEYELPKVKSKPINSKEISKLAKKVKKSFEEEDRHKKKD